MFQPIGHGAKYITLLRLYMLLLVSKNAKKIPNGKYMENFLKPLLFIDNIYFAKIF